MIIATCMISIFLGIYPENLNFQSHLQRGGKFMERKRSPVFKADGKSWQ